MWKKVVALVIVEILLLLGVINDIAMARSIFGLSEQETNSTEENDQYEGFHFLSSANQQGDDVTTEQNQDLSIMDHWLISLVYAFESSIEMGESAEKAIEFKFSYPAVVYETQEMANRLSPVEKLIFLRLALCADVVPNISDSTPAIRAAWENSGIQYEMLLLMQEDGAVGEVSPVTPEDMANLSRSEYADSDMFEYHAQDASLTLRYVSGEWATTPSSSAGDVSKPALEKQINDRECSACFGNGKCFECMGEGTIDCLGGCINGRCLACDDGRILVGFDLNDRARYEDCTDCRAGDCNTCLGTGEMACFSCNGSGVCGACAGNGIGK